METSERHRDFLDHCCEVLGVQLHEVLGKGRSVQHVVRARQAITWAIHERHSELSWSKLAKLLKRDHTTLMHAAGQFAKALHSGADWALSMAALIERRTVADQLPGLETLLDTLRSCPGIDLSTATDMPIGAVG